MFCLFPSFSRACSLLSHVLISTPLCLPISTNQPTNQPTFSGFLAFYFFSTVVVGAIVRKLVTITFKHNENLVEDEIVRATTWVHKTALLTDRPDEVLTCPSHRIQSNEVIQMKNGLAVRKILNKILFESD
jgi:hypothetical protein